MKVKQLFEELEKKYLAENAEEIFTSSSMTNRFNELEFGFFPLGSGILSENSKIEDAEISEGGVMVLGNDFGTVSYIESKCKDKKESKNSPTIRNLLKLELNTNSTFFTNFYLGLRTSANATMIKRSHPITEKYKLFCYEFFLTQLELIKPKLVLCLGKDIHATMHEEWIDRTLQDTYNFKFIPHPSFAHINWKEPFLTELKQTIKNNQSPRRGFGSMKGMFTIMPDFDEPLEDFKDYR